MSEHPLKPTNLTLIVLGWNVNQIDDALLQYGPEQVALATVHKVDDSGANMAEVLALPVDTPWCRLDYANPVHAYRLAQRFGVWQPLSKCLDMRNQDDAIHPRKIIW